MQSKEQLQSSNETLINMPISEFSEDYIEYLNSQECGCGAKRCTCDEEE